MSMELNASRRLDGRIQSKKIRKAQLTLLTLEERNAPSETLSSLGTDSLFYSLATIGLGASASPAASSPDAAKVSNPEPWVSFGSLPLSVPATAEPATPSDSKSRSDNANFNTGDLASQAVLPMMDFSGLLELNSTPLAAHALEITAATTGDGPAIAPAPSVESPTAGSTQNDAAWFENPQIQTANVDSTSSATPSARTVFMPPLGESLVAGGTGISGLSPSVSPTTSPSPLPTSPTSPTPTSPIPPTNPTTPTPEVPTNPTPPIGTTPTTPTNPTSPGTPTTPTNPTPPTGTTPTTPTNPTPPTGTTPTSPTNPTSPGAPTSPTTPTFGSTTGFAAIESDTDPAHVNDVITFDVYAISDPGITFLSVAWDFNYNGTTFHADSSATSATVSRTFATTGTRTVAAQVATLSGAMDLVWMTFKVLPPAPVVTPPLDFTVVAGETKTLNVSATTFSSQYTVEWWVSFNGEYYEQDPSLTGLTPSYTFDTVGDYDFWVTVTDANGETGDAWFHVTASNDVPEGDVSYVGPNGQVMEEFDEGQSVTFTVRNLTRELNVENLDMLSVYVKWTDADADFELVSQGDLASDGWQYDAARDVMTFTHFYDDGPASNQTNAKIRLEDGWGAYTDKQVTVKVRNVAPTGTLTVVNPSGAILGEHQGGGQSATLEDDGQDVWEMRGDQEMTFANASDRSGADMVNLKYHWQIDGTTLPDATAFVLPEDKRVVGSMHQVIAWISDDDGGKTQEQSFTLVVAGNGSDIAIGLAVDRNFLLIDHSVNAYDQFASVADVTGGANSSGIYGTLLPASMDLPAGYNRYGTLPIVTSMVNAGDPLEVHFQLDEAGQALASAPGTTTRYIFTSDIYKLKETKVNGQKIFVRDQLINHQHSTDSSSTDYSVPMLEADQLVDVTLIVQQWRAGESAPRYSDPYRVTFQSRETPNWWEQFAGGLTELMARFGSNADKLIEAFRTGGTTALSNLANALSDEVKLYLTNLPKDAQEIFYKWLTDGMNANIDLTGLNLSNLEDIKTLLLQYSGISTRSQPISCALEPVVVNSGSWTCPS